MAVRSRRITLLDGAQDALDRLIDATVNFGDRVIVETPTFPPVLDMLELAGAEVIGVPVDPEGPVVGAVEAALDRGPTVAIVQPRAHNPSGVALSETRAASWLHDSPNTMCSSSKTTTPAWSQGAASQSRCPSTRPNCARAQFLEIARADLRLAAVGGPSEIIDVVVRRRQLGPSWTSRLLQRVLLGLLTDPAAEAAVRDAEQTYLVRRRTLVDALDRAGVTVDTNGSGLNLWIPVDDERRRRGACGRRHRCRARRAVPGRRWRR